MRQIYFTLFIVALVALPPIAPVLPGFQAQVPAQRKALILSPLEQYAPMGYSANIQSLLTNAGYQVTVVTNTAVTVDFILNHLNDYNLVIWRTNTYEWAHQLYWYIGEIYNSATAQKYASDFAAGSIDYHNGLMGINLAFYNNHYTPGSLSNVKLAVLISSVSSTLAPSFLNAGVTAVVFCYNSFSLTYNSIDYVTMQLLYGLSYGQNVGDAVSNTVNPYVTMILRDKYDSNFFPPFWYSGDSTVTIT